MRYPTWGVPDAWHTLFLALGLGLAAYLLAVPLHFDPMNGWGLLFTAAVPWAAMIGWPVVVAKRKGNGAQIDFGLQLTKAHVRTAVLAAVYAYGGAGLVALVIEKVHGPFNSVAGQVASAQRGIVLVVFALTMVTIAPLAEEIAFRGLLYTALCKRGVSEIAAVLISALAFAAFHFEPTRLPLLFAIGVVLGEVRRRTGSTAASVITHVLNNAPSAISLIVTAVGTFLHR